MPRPDHFVIVGAQRCGTSYLTRLLDEHSDIEMAKPYRPEPKFFLDDAQYARGVGFYESTYFSDPSARVRGEKSTSYIESDVAIDRIVATLPEAAIVVVLRDPVARAISNYRFSVEHGSDDLPIDDALRASASGERPFDASRFSVSPYAYLPRGRYVDYLERLAGRVARDQLRVVIFEELVARPDVVHDLYERLGVDPDFRPSGLGTVVNASAADAEDTVDPDLTTWLRDYYAEPNRRLAEFLSAPLPWPT